ncbi:MAG: hypothetical protein VB858_19780 [Planctomycetaceae bacterium]
MTLHWLDLTVILAYLAFSIGLGVVMSRRQSGREEFFAASRSMGWFTVGLSVMATLFSANSFVMYPSAAYSDSLRVGLALMAFVLMAPIVIWVFVPVYAKLKVGTAYEYLERRFHVSVRCLASGLFVLLRIGWMASATYAASVAIAGISGLNLHTIILGLGLVAVLYTMLGGLRAVMWTDVLQFFVFAGTILFAMGLLVSQSEGGFAGIRETYFQGRSNLVVNFDLDPTIRFGTIAVLIGSFLEGLSAFGADQVAVQRYIAAKNAKTSQIGFGINLAGMFLVIPGLLAIGMGLFSYFTHNPSAMADVVLDELAATASPQTAAVKQMLLTELPSSEQFRSASADFYQQNPARLHEDVVRLGLQDQALPEFVKLKFSPGVVGLLVAALMAATMSSIDSGIHSVTTALVVDFRDRLMPRWKPKTERGEMFTARILLVLIGAVAVTLACFVSQLGDVFAVAKKTTAAFGGPLLAVFILGMFWSRATSCSVFAGTLAGAVFTAVMMDRNPDWFSMWFWPLGFFSTLGLSALLCVLPVPWNTNCSGSALTFWKLRGADSVEITTEVPDEAVL